MDFKTKKFKNKNIQIFIILQRVEFPIYKTVRFTCVEFDESTKLKKKKKKKKKSKI